MMATLPSIYWHFSPWPSRAARHTQRDTHKWATPLPGKTRLIVLNFNQSIGTTFNNMFNVYSSFNTIDFKSLIFIHQDFNLCPIIQDFLKP